MYMVHLCVHVRKCLCQVVCAHKCFMRAALRGRFTCCHCITMNFGGMLQKVFLLYLFTSSPIHQSTVNTLNLNVQLL